VRPARVWFTVAWIVPGIAALYLLIRRDGLDDGAAPQVYASLTSLALLLIPLVLLARDDVVTGLRRAVDGRPGRSLALAAALPVAYLPYWVFAAKTGLSGFLAVLAVVGAAALCATGVRRRRAGDGGDILVVLLIWLPVELRLLDAAFPWPEGGSGRIIAALLALDCLLFLMLVVRRYDGAGYSFRMTWRDLALAIGAFIAFAAIAVPIGLGTGFLTVGRQLPEARDLLLGGATILLITGIPEEVLFRGFLQSFIERWIGRPLPALVVASVLFGAAHLNNGPTPDWRYFVLATIAGMAYGYVFWKTKRIGPAVITHTLVDLTWTRFFMG
jgi:membrane protease YdiL (CAAX protease family)